MEVLPSGLQPGKGGRAHTSIARQEMASAMRKDKLNTLGAQGTSLWGGGPVGTGCFPVDCQLHWILRDVERLNGGMEHSGQKRIQGARGSKQRVFTGSTEKLGEPGTQG